MNAMIFRSGRKADTYLYVSADREFESLPRALRQQFGTPTWVMDLELSAERTLAQADVAEVMRALQDNGFYLQLPPPTTI